MTQWCTIAYITSNINCNNQLELPVDLGNGVSLINFPDLAKDKKYFETLNQYERYEIIKDVKFAFCTEYEAEALDSQMSTSKEDKPAFTKVSPITFLNVLN